MITALIWGGALFASIAALRLTGDCAHRPPMRGAGLDKPLNRALIHTIAWMALIMAIVFAAYIDGLVWPILVCAGFWFGLGQAARRGAFQRRHWLSGPLAFVSLILVFALFQIVFGDDFFGLIGAQNPLR